MELNKYAANKNADSLILSHIVKYHSIYTKRYSKDHLFEMYSNIRQGIKLVATGITDELEDPMDIDEVYAEYERRMTDCFESER